MLFLFLFLLAIPLLLLLVEFAAERRDLRRYPAPGRILPSANLHVLEMGNGPSVILESGLAASSISWVQTQKAAQNFARVVAYDRAGLGWSPRRAAPPILKNLLADLDNVVAAQTKPVILVGHSFGGLLVGAYAHLHPGNVSGIVLVDPVSLETYSQLNDFHRGRLNRGIQLSKRGALLARFAIVRISLSLVARGAHRVPLMIGRVSAGKGSGLMRRLAGEIAKLPREAYGPIRSHWSRPAAFRLISEYLRLLPESATQATAMPIPPEIPVIVLSAATAQSSELIERDSLVANRPRSRHHQIPATTHWVQLDRPDLVVEAIRELISG